MLLTRLACCSLQTLPATRCLGANGRKSDASLLVSLEGSWHDYTLPTCRSAPNTESHRRGARIRVMAGTWLQRIRIEGGMPARSGAAAVAALVFVSTAVIAQSRMTFEEAAPVMMALPSNLPIDLRGRSTPEIARLWPSWVERHDRTVRGRLARGDEDSLVNFWLYGTSFTAQPPAIARASPISASALDDIVKARLRDFLDRVTTSRDDERLEFALRVLTERNADPRVTGGRERAREFLLDARQRMLLEFANTDQALTAASAQGAAALTAANATI